MRPYYEPYSDDYPVGASRADLRAAPPQLSQKVFYGGQAWQPVPRGRQVHLKPWEQATPQERGRTYRGPVHLPGNRGGIIPRGRYHKAFTPNTQRQHNAVNAYGRGGRGGGTWANPRVRRRSASRGSQRGQSPGRRSQRGRSGSAHSNRSFGVGPKKGKALAVSAKHPALAAVHGILSALRRLKPDAPVAFSAEDLERFAKRSAELSDAKAKRDKGIFRFANAKTLADLETIDPASLDGKTRGEAIKEVLKVERKSLKAVKIAKKAMEDHERHKEAKSELLQANLARPYTDDTNWHEAALEIARQASVKVSKWSQLHLILPYVVHEKFLLERLRTPAEKSKVKSLVKEHIDEVIKWLVGEGKAFFAGFEPIQKMSLGDMGAQGAIDTARKALHDATLIHSGAILVQAGGNFEEHGNLELHLALHAHLIRAGIAVQPSEYAAPAAAAAGLSSFAAAPPGPPRYVPLVRF